MENKILEETIQDAMTQGSHKRKGPPIPDTTWVQRKFLDIPYANVSESQKLDIYLPDMGEGPFPVLFFIHGGGFASGSRKDDPPLCPILNGSKKGYAIVSIDYRLSGEAPFPAAPKDCRAALRYIRRHASAYMLDAECVAVIGGSAGGNLAGLMATAYHSDVFDDENLGPSDADVKVQAAVLWFMPTNMGRMDEQEKIVGNNKFDHDAADSPESKYLGGLVQTLPEETILQTDPTTYIRTDVSPLLIEHGLNDQIVPFLQSVVFYEKLRQTVEPDRYVFRLIPGENHGGDEFFEEDGSRRVFEFWIQLCLIERKDNHEKIDRSLWNTPVGGVSRKETPLESMQRIGSGKWNYERFMNEEIGDIFLERYENYLKYK